MAQLTERAITDDPAYQAVAPDDFAAMLEAEGDTMVGDAITAEGIEYLREINKKRRVIGQKPLAV
jgi:hypothetical protein